MKVVIRVGGSVVASPPNPSLISKYVDLLKNLKGQGHEVVAVVGGGTLARDFIRIAGELGLDEHHKDWIAIHVSRLYAQLFAMLLGKVACKTIPSSLDEVLACLKRKKIVVMGGLKPGMTTDTVAAMISERMNAHIWIKTSDVDGVYTKDPKKHSNARKIEKLKFKDLVCLFEKNKHKAGIHQILDPETVKILQKAKTKVVIVNGFRPKNVLLALKGEKVGTTIQ